MDRILSSSSTHNHYLSRDHHYCSFSSLHPPALYVEPGEIVCIETWDCYGGLFFDANQQPIQDPGSVLIDRSKLNPVTGPIFINSAEPGDILAVTIHDITPKSLGVAQCGPTFGQLSHTVTKHHFRFFDILPTEESETWSISMREPLETNVQRIAPISFRAKPMIGVMGVAPPEASISTMPAGKHGGNLDNPFNATGSTIYLNVFHPGALFSVGDVHASQGDGEICGTGVEIAATVVLSFQVLTKPGLDRGIRDSNDIVYPCRFPITETKSAFMTYGVVLDDIPTSTVVACDEASKLLQQQWCFTAQDAYIFLGVCGHLGLCQANHPDVNNTPIARMVIPKIDACPRPFACLLEKKYS